MQISTHFTGVNGCFRSNVVTGLLHIAPFELKRYAVTVVAALTELSNFAFYKFVDYFH